MTTRLLDVWRAAPRGPWALAAGALLLAALLGSTPAAAQVTVSVVDGSDEVTPVSNYRWLVEQDLTYHVPFDEFGNPVPDPYTQAVSFHRSYMPVVAEGMTGGTTDLGALLSGLPADVCSVGANACSVDTDCIVNEFDRCVDAYYYVSVLPASGYSIGGALFKPGDTELKAYVNPNPIPTAQIVVQVCEDTNPINNVCDPGEDPLPNFKVIIEDAGGRYGMSAGLQSYDVYGWPLGTRYGGTCAIGGGACELDADCGLGDYCSGYDYETPIEIGSGLDTGPDGFLHVKNLAPGKYGVIVVAPAGEGWQQTSTIEGKRVIDAWVKANEPPFFAEFGPPGPHVFVGFVQPFNEIPAGGTTNVTGQVVNLHMSRPPEFAMYAGGPFPHTNCWVGLNDFTGGVPGEGLYAQPCEEDGHFAIPNVPAGDYQLVAWDDNLDLIFLSRALTVNANGTCYSNPERSCNLGPVPARQWFTRMEHWVFNDLNGDGQRTCVTETCMSVGEGDEPGIPEQAVNLRWRDGTMYQSFATDLYGFAPFDEVFPFFSWLVAEVDFARFDATGATMYVDDGGAIEFLNPNTWGGQLNPQDHTNPATGPGTETTEWRSEDGLVLTQAFQGFLGQTSVVEWGKRAYGPTENGGISGVVYYSTTRAEDDPRYGGAEPWEPGIPGVTVNLYDEMGTTLLDTTTTDSWDATPPADCKWGNDLDGPFVFRDRDTDCYDGMRVWNQIRPGVFDGGYAFDGLDPGRYVVEVIPPAGYSIVRSQDKNVDFGDEYEISGLLLPPECVGASYTVPQYLSLNDVPWVVAGDKVEAPLWGQSMPDCDRKLVTLSNGSNSAADFFLFTQVPAAAHAVGFILDDTANEFDPNSPQFGEKYAPPFLPVGIRDWTGREIGRTYSDEYGRYNFLTASTWTNSLPQPSGMSPNMITTCMNAKLKADQSSDLLHNSQYSQFCYTFQYMPGATVYLDTPVVPVAAFTGANQFPLDCEYEDGTPRVFSATNGSNGPWLPADVGTLTITAMGDVDVPNPAYDGVGGTEPRLIARDYNFGCPAAPTVTIGGVPATVGSCTTGTDGRDVLTVTTGAGTATGQLVISRADTGLSTVNAVTVHVGGAPPTVVTGPAPFPNGAIQTAIDGAEFAPGQLITVAPGNYQEMVIMWNPVRLQGWGEGTTIDAVKTPPEALQLWRDTVAGLVNDMKITLVPGQEAAFGGIEPAALWTEEGAGVIVLAKAGDFAGVGASIDGFNITGADTGGGIIVNGYGADLQISNNRVINNSGFYGGGVRVGHPFLVTNGAGCPDGGPDPCYPDAMNDNVVIRHNYIGQNGGIQGAGGGVSLCTGSDGYQLTDNYICGNFNLQQGGGVAHFGLSDGGLIARNAIVFNDSFNQGPNSSPAGGGVLIAGQPALAPALLTLGSGDVYVDSNLILGNAAEAGDGGGIRLQQVNGQDVADANNRPSRWHRIDIVNNIVANNLAALAGGGISLFDAKRTFINHNSIANNNSTATAGAAFSAASTADLRSEGQLGAGIVSRRHSDALIAVQRSNNAIYSDPRMADNIVWHNRTFLFNGLGTTPDPNLGGASWFGLCPDIGGIADNCPVELGLWAGIDPYYSDIAVLGVPGTTSLNCDPCIVSDLGGPDPMFVAEYVTGGREPTVEQPEQQTIFTPTAFDEGGNFIRLRFGPLTRWDPVTGDLFGDYHLDLGSPAIDTGAEPDPAYDFDQEPRPNGADPDIGADEYYPAAAMMAVPAGAFDSSAARAHGAQ